MRIGVSDAGQTNERTNNRTLKIELLSHWKLEAEFRKNYDPSVIAIVIITPCSPPSRHLTPAVLLVAENT